LELSITSDSWDRWPYWSINDIKLHTTVCL